MSKTGKGVLCLNRIMAFIILHLASLIPLIAQNTDSTETTSPRVDSLAQQPKQEVDSLSLNKPISQNADSLINTQIADSLNIDSAKASLPPPVYFFESELESIKKMDVPQRPLPDSLNFSILDSVGVDYVHINALKKKFRYFMEAQPDSANFLSISFPDTTVRSWAEVESYGQLIAEARLQKEFFFRSDEEFTEYWKAIKERVDKLIKVKIHVITGFPMIAQADSSTISVFLVKDVGNEISAIGLKKAPIKTNMWGMYTWYERDIIASFPRYQGVQDIWEQGNLKVVVNLNVPKEYAESGKRLFNFHLYETMEE